MKPLPFKTKLALAVVAFVVVEAVLILFLDRPAAVWGQSVKFSFPAVYAFMRGFTNVGDSAWYLWPCGVALLLAAFLSRGKDVPSRYRRLFGYIGVRALFIFACVGISGIAVNILKQLIGRPRPIEWLQNGSWALHPFNGHWVWTSMPSGHATTVFSLYFVLALIAPKMKHIWLLIAVAVGVSRVVVNAHYPSDVIAGAAFGLLTSWAFHKYGMNRVSKVIFPIDSSPRS